MKFTIIVESDDSVVHVTAVSKNKVSLGMTISSDTVKVNRLSDNSIIISDVS